MSTILSQIETGRKIGPPRGVIFGHPKSGKTTLLASIPGIVVVPLEDGQGTLDYPRTPQPETYDAFMLTLKELAITKHGYKAVGIDGLNGVEELIWRWICTDNDWVAFHAYGRGPRQAAVLWQDVCKALNAIRARGIAIWCAAHSKDENAEDVTVGTYRRVSPALDKHALGVVAKWSDLIGCIEIERMAKEVGGKEPATKTRTSRTTGVRRLIVEDDGAHMAGNRYGLGSPIELPEENPYGPLRAALRASIAVKPAPVSEPEETNADEQASATEEVAPQEAA